MEAGHARRNLALHLDSARLQPKIGDRRNQRDHSEPLYFPEGFDGRERGGCRGVVRKLLDAGAECQFQNFIYTPS